MDQVLPTGKTVTLIHYLYRASGADPGWRIACMPSMTEFHETMHHPAYQRTDDVHAVTCPGCKRTDVYRSAFANAPR